MTRLDYETIKMLDHKSSLMYLRNQEKYVIKQIMGLWVQGEPMSRCQQKSLAVILRNLEKRKEQYKTWCETFGPKHRENWEVAQTYALQPMLGWPRGRTIANNWAKGEIPTQHDYNILVQNKTTKKILKGWYAQPRYKNGQMVRLKNLFRSGMRRIRSMPFDVEDFASTAVFDEESKGTIFIVVDSNTFVPRNPNSGNKVYKLLPMNHLVKQPVYLEERMLRNL